MLATSKTRNKRRRAPSYGLYDLLEALLLARLLSSEENLPEVLVRSAAILKGAEFAQETLQAFKEKRKHIPHKTQLSRARIKLDMLLMLLRQAQWSEMCPSVSSEPGCFLFLSCDASPLGGKEFFLAIEDRVTRKDAASLVGASDSDLQEFSRNGCLETSSLPVTLLGSGATSSAAKAECLAHSLLLDTAKDGDPLWTSLYSKSIVCLCTDFGPEGHLNSMPPMDLRELQQVAVKESKGLLSDDGIGAPRPHEFISSVVCEDLVLPPPLDAVIDVDGLDPTAESVHHQAGLGQPMDPGRHLPKAEFDLQSSILVPGTKHLIDNIQSEILKGLSYFHQFQEPCSWLTRYQWATSQLGSCTLYLLDSRYTRALNGVRFPN